MKNMNNSNSFASGITNAKRVVLLIVLALLVQTSQAHHGKDFLVASSCTTPHEGSLCAHFNTQYFSENHSSESLMLFSSGLIYGLTDDIGLEFHSHFNTMSSSTHVEALALEARYNILSEADEHSSLDGTTNPFSLATSLEFEKGIVGHPSVLESRLIIGKEFGFIMLVGNLVVMQEFEEGQHPETQFVIGMKTMITNSIGMLVELLNNNHHTEGTQLSLGCSIALMKKFDVTIGTNFINQNHGTMISSFQSMMMYTF
ncbi:MAG: hypothetical protein Q8L88_02030 [Bacteroidota bacterium]|nr:hypothetical protein [Bacteroidota bacterium]